VDSARELGRRLHAADPDEFGSADAARMALSVVLTHRRRRTPPSPRRR
jgi:hypothetical protein